MDPFSFGRVDSLAPDVLTLMRAAFVQSVVALAVVATIWAIFRRKLSNAAAHALFLIVPVKTAAAVLFVLWPVGITLSLPLPVSALPVLRSNESVDPPQKMPLASKVQWLDELQSASEPLTIVGRNEETRSEFEITDLARKSAENPLALNASSVGSPISAKALAMLAWAIGLVVTLSVFLAKHFRLIYRLRRFSSPESGIGQNLVDELAETMGLRRRPVVMESSAVATPAVVGFFRPMLVVPFGFFRAFDQNECRWAVAHELAHIRRFDLWSLAFERAVGLVFFFCPALWVSQRVTRYFRELACDDVAQATSGLSGGDCAQTFLKLIVWSARKGAETAALTPALSLTHRYPAIRRRIMNMTDTNEMRRTPRLAPAAALAIMAFAVVLALPVVPKLVAQSPRDDRNGIVIARNEEITTEVRQADESQAKTRSIGGQIVDENDRPVANAEVQFLIWLIPSSEKGPDRLEPVRTGDDGSFRIEGVPAIAPISSVQITHPDFVNRQFRFRFQEPEYEPLLKGNARIELKKGITVKGRVLDPDGKPLPDAAVTQWFKAYFSDASKRMTNAAGEFVFEHLDETGFDALIVTKPGFGAVIGKLNHAQRPPGELVLKMERARSLKGKVTDEAGNPIADVRLSLDLKHSPNEFRAEARTDAEGVFRFDDLPVGRDVSIQLLKKGYAESSFSLKADQQVEPSIKLLKGVTGNGTVVDAETSKPVERFEITIVPFEDRSLVQSSNTYPFHSGAFEIGVSTVSPKRFRLKFEADGYRTFESEEYAIEKCPVELNVKLDPIPQEELPRYRGKVVAQDGTPIANARIGLSTQKDFPLIHEGAIYATQRGRVIPVTDTSGAFDFRSLEPVREILILHDTGTVRKPIEPGTDLNTIELKLQPYGQIAVKLLRDGKPDRDSRIAMFYESGVSRYMGSGRWIEPKPDGSFLLERVIPGVVDIDFRLAGIPENGRFTWMLPYLVEPGKTTTIERDLKLSDGPRRDVKGKIRFVNRPIPMNLSGSKFILQPPAGNPLRLKPGDSLFNSPARTKYRETPEGKAMHQAMEEFLILEKSMTPDGEFEIKGMPVGRYELRISAGNSNTRLGDAVREIRIEPSKPGEPVAAVDLGFLDIEPVKNPSRKPDSKESSKSNAESKAKSGS